jgi:hypothetical protein
MELEPFIENADSKKKIRYAQLGEFMAKFENVFWEMRTGIKRITNGDEQTNYHLDALTAEMGVHQLLNAYRSMLTSQHFFSPFGKKVINRIYSDIDDLIKTRNDVIHSTWFIEYSDANFFLAAGIKLRNTKNGVSMREVTMDDNDFREILLRCEEALSLTTNAWLAYLTNEWEKSFVFDGSKLKVHEN